MSMSTSFIADHYCVSHVSAATIPGSRLSNVLARMYQGEPVSRHALDFLQQQELLDLYRLACGEITHKDYIAGLDAAYLKKYEAAKAARQAKESEQQALEAHYRMLSNMNPARNAFPVRDWKAERKLRHKREREASEAVLKAQRVRQAEWKAQRERNSELADIAYRARSVSPDYTAPTAHDIALYFHLGHFPAAACPPMCDILEALYRGRPLTEDELNDLERNGPKYLYRLAFGQLNFDAYIVVVSAAEAEAEAVEAARIARESDPAYMAMMQTQTLYPKYGLSPAAKSQTPRMTDLLRQIDAGSRLAAEEVAWLSTTARKKFTKEIREAYHRLEATFHAEKYRTTQDPWDVINASGHYRKCDQSGVALDLIDSLPRRRLTHSKLKSALLTTRGGVMRDLGRRPEAIQMGEEAHALMPRDYRPCTLLGAVYTEQREFERGKEWYDTARKLGASENSVESELRGIFQRLDSSGQEAMKRFLLAEDSHRYAWLNEKKQQKAPSSRPEG